MSDVPPSLDDDTFNYVLTQSNSSEDEIIEIVKQEIYQLMRQSLEVMVIRIFQRTSGGPVMEDMIRRILTEQIEMAVKNLLPSVHTSAPRRLTLRFRNDPPSRILTGKEIKGKACDFLEVALVDYISGQVVESMPEAYADVEIVVLKGNEGDSDNWTSEEFNHNIVQESKGKKSLLAGDVVVKLNKGIGVVSNIKFKNSSKWMKREDFKLGARVMKSFPGTHIGEAKTESFTVKDCRNEYYKNSEIPALADEVWRLKNIAKDKKIHKNLQEQQIHTVEDFLVLLFKDPERLKRIAGMKPKHWEVSMKHARTCKIDNRMACYIDSQRNEVVVFNLVDQVLGVVSGCQYIPVDKLSRNKKEDAYKLAVYAIDNKKDLVYLADEASLLRYLSSLSASVNPGIPERHEHHTGQDIEVTEMTIECSYTRLSITSDGPSQRSIGSLSISDYEIMENQVLMEQGNLSAFDTMLQDFDEYEREKLLNDNDGDQFKNLIVEACANQEIAAATSLVEEARPSKRWVVLISVLSLRWASMRRKKVSLRKLPVRKKQRVQ